MTTSPLYPVELPAAGLPHSINVDRNTYEGWTGVDTSRRYHKPRLLLEEVSELRWRNRFDLDDQDLPFDDQAEKCYLGALTDVSCRPELGYPAFADLYLDNRENLARTKDDAGQVDYELPLFVEAGYGLTTTRIHEVGHHLGMSHPHDGYDSATAVGYGPRNEFFFAWTGDETNSVMSYIDVNWDFSQFDRDNSDRFLTAAYVEGANRLAGPAVTCTVCTSSLTGWARTARAANPDRHRSERARSSSRCRRGRFDEARPVGWCIR